MAAEPSGEDVKTGGSARRGRDARHAGRAAVMALTLVWLAAPGLASAQAALEYGPFRLVPTLGMTGTFTDNVVLAPPGQAESDFIWTLGLGLALKLRGSNYGGNVGYRADILRYVENTDLNTTRQTAFADGRWDLLGGRLALTLAEVFNHSDEFVGGPVPEFTQLVLHNENTLEFDAEYRLADAWSVAIGYRFYLIDYLDSSFDDLNYKDRTLHVAAYYRISPKTALLVRYDYDQIRYDQASDADRNSDSNFVWAGLRGDLTAKTSAEVRFGAQFQDFADGTSTTNWVANAQVVWKYRDPSQVRMFFLRSNNQSTFVQEVDGQFLDNTYVGTYGGAEVAHRFTPRLAAKLFGLLGTNNYPDQTTQGSQTAKRLDWVYAVGLGARYDFRRWLSFEVGYALRLRSSNFSEFDYTENRVTAAILLTF